MKERVKESGETPAICYKGTGAGLFSPSPSSPLPLHFFLLLLYRSSLRRLRSPALSTGAVPLLYAPFTIFLLLFSSFPNSLSFSSSLRPSFIFFSNAPSSSSSSCSCSSLCSSLCRETTRGHERGSTRVCVRSRRSAGESLTAGHSPPVPYLPLM